MYCLIRCVSFLFFLLLAFSQQSQLIVVPYPLSVVIEFIGLCKEGFSFEKLRQFSSRFESYSKAIIKFNDCISELSLNKKVKIVSVIVYSVFQHEFVVIPLSMLQSKRISSNKKTKSYRYTLNDL